MQHRDYAAIRKIMENIDAGIDFLGSMSFDEFCEKKKEQYAVAMVEVQIGELTKAVSDSFKKAHPEIPWKEAAALRNVAVHQYEALRVDDVYNTCTKDFPALKAQLQNILETDS